MRDILLFTEHLTMQFGGVVAVDDLNIKIPTGEITASLALTELARPLPSTSSLAAISQPMGGSPLTER